MPRFFFRTEDGKCFPDLDGTELSGVEAAKAEAILTFGEMIREFQDEFWKCGALRLYVKDEASVTLFTLDLRLTEPGRGRMDHQYARVEQAAPRP